MTAPTKFYQGGEIITRESIFCRLPGRMNGVQWVRLESLTFSIMAAETAWHTLRELADRQGADVGVSRRLKAAMFNAAWAIVDSLEAVRQLITVIWARGGEQTDALIKALEPIGVVRVRLRHLGNFAKQEAERSTPRPVFDLLSYLVANTKSGSIFGMHHVSGRMAFGVRVSAPRSFGLQEMSGVSDHFMLTVADQEIAFSPLLAQVAEWVVGIEPLIERDLKSAAELIAVEQNLPIEEVTAVNLGDVSSMGLLGTLPSSGFH